MRDVAREAGVTATTITRWRASAAAAPPADVAARARAIVAGAPAPEPELEDPAPPEDDGLAYARWQRRQLLRAAATATREARFDDASKARRDAANMSLLIARLERGATQDADVIRVSRADVDQAMAGVRERVAAILERPLLCAACSRALNVEIVGGDKGR